MKNSPYFEQVKLMLEALFYVTQERDFALKGGTAINLFLRDMPRLSVDIDLTYLPLESRESSLQKISEALSRLAVQLKENLPETKIREVRLSKPSRLTKLVLETSDFEVKIEPNEVLRGSVFPTETHDLCLSAQKAFEMELTVRTLSLADIYAGKLCAALDRQHPRDFFDVKWLLEKEGLNDAIRKAFVIYLASSDRPMHELLRPNRVDFTNIFKSEFEGMEVQKVKCEELEEVREKLLKAIPSFLTGDDRKFLVSLKKGEPQWDLLGLKEVEKFPAIQWKLANIKKMSPERHRDQLAKLEQVLGQ